MIPLFSLFYSPIDQTKRLINNQLYELRSIKSISMQRFAPINLIILYYSFKLQDNYKNDK